MNPFEMVIHLASDMLASVLGASIVWKVVGIIALIGVGYRTLWGMIGIYDWIRDRAGGGRLTDYLLQFKWFELEKAKYFVALLPILPLVAILYAGVTAIAGLLKL